MNSKNVIKKAANGNLTISNINVVDVINGVVNHNTTIHIADGLISNISKINEMSKSINHVKENEVELWAIPGLIDAHVHLLENHQAKHIDAFEMKFDLAKKQAFINIEEALKVGVTCARDTGAYSAYNNKIRDIIEENPEELPFRIVSCGHHITKEDGHWSNRGILWDPQKYSLKEMVYNELNAGADYIKVMNENPIFDLDELKVIASTCKEMGRKFSCHSFTRKTIHLAFEAGADTIEHAACFSDDFSGKVIEKGVAICPTVIAAVDSIANITEVLQIHKDCDRKVFEDWHDFLHEHLPETFKAGVKVIAGTDAGTYPTNFQSLPREIIQLNKLGATCLQALQSATINAAEALDIADIIGSLETNKSADLVLLGKNPLDNLAEAILDVKVVISRGHVVINNLES